MRFYTNQPRFFCGIDLHARSLALCRYCQLKPDLALSTRGAGSLIPDKSMDYSQVNCLFSVQFSLS